MPSRKMTGAIVAGSSAPRTRRTSLSERRQSANATGSAEVIVLMRCAGAPSAPASRARSSRARAGWLPRSRQRVADRPLAGQQPAHGLDDVGQRVVLRDRAQRGGEQVAREERRRGEQQHEHEREDALEQRERAGPQRDRGGEAADSDRGDRRQRDRRQRRGRTAGIAGAEREADAEEERRLQDRQPERAGEAADNEARAAYRRGQQPVEEAALDVAGHRRAAREPG